MSSLLLRRAVVWLISAALGVFVTILLLTFFLPAVSPNPNAEAVSVAKYGIQYFFWTAFPFTLLFVTVLDYFLDTKILPD